MVGLSNDRTAGDSAIWYTKKSFDAAAKEAAHADRQSGRLSCGSTGVPSCLISAEQLWELSHVDVFAFKACACGSRAGLASPPASRRRLAGGCLSVPVAASVRLMLPWRDPAGIGCAATAGAAATPFAAQIGRKRKRTFL